MSTTLTLLESDVHGTVAGYRAGCKGSACAGTVACRDVYRRYVGDFAFARRVDAGESPAAIIAEEEAEAEAVRARDKAAARAERAASMRAARPPKPRRPPGAPRVVRAPRTSRVTAAEQHSAEVARLHAEGLMDVEIARQLGIARSTVGRLRRALGLETHRPVREDQPKSGGARAARLRELHAAGLTDQEIADQLGSTRTAVYQARTRAGLPINRVQLTPRKPRERSQRHDHTPAVAQLVTEGLTDSEIADRLTLSPSHVGTLRRRAGLPVNRSARTKWDQTQLQPHGTNACYARGCRLPECIEAHKQYHRDYVKRRRQEGARKYHGTAYGYQLGCRDRGTCPATPTCPDASLAAEEARRRAAGIPPKVLVDAAPAQAHMRDLIHAGLTVAQIADRAGLTFAVARKIVHSQGADRGVVRTVRADRAAAILAVPIPERSEACAS